MKEEEVETPRMAHNAPTCISVVNHKGGVGKSTTAYNYAAWLDKQGFNTLLIDLDPQCDASSAFGIPVNKEDRSRGQHRNEYFLSDLLQRPDQISLEQVVVSVGDANLQILPGDEELEAVSAGLPPQVLARAVLPYLKDIDYCLIDIKPSLSTLISNALTTTAAFPRSSVLVPMQYGKWEREGLNRFLTTLEQFTSTFAVDPFFYVFLAKIDMRVKKARGHALTELRQFGSQLLDTAIRQNQALQDALDYDLSIFDHAPMSRGARDYKALFTEHLAKISQSYDTIQHTTETRAQEVKPVQ